MALPAGARLGPYEVVALLGGGGMGVVYRARDPRLGREVAIKVLSPAASGDPDHLRRLEREARVAGTLNHPNIVAVHDVGRHELGPYVVTELLEGETLRERLTDRLPLRKALDYAVQIARGLAAAHERGIVHRDLKPENVFATRDGRIKILDFGLAKLARGPFAAATGDTTATLGFDTTAPGTVLGTVGYMSPEQVKGRPADARSDIFSFGALLYEMLSGRRAFHGGSTVDTLNAILNLDPPELAELDDLPPPVERVVRRCLEKRPEERFQSARDVAFALEALSGLSARSLTPPLVGASSARRRLIAAGVLALLLGSYAAVFLAARQATSRQPPSFRRITFRPAGISAARFAPDGRTVVYSVTTAGREELLEVRPGSLEPRPLGIADAKLASISSAGEMALLTRPVASQPVLARAPLAGGSPKELLEDVEDADWSPDGRTLAVIRSPGREARVEFPPGHAVYKSSGRLGGLSVSRQGDRVAFVESAPDGSATSLVVVDSGGRRALLGLPAEALSSAWRDGDVPRTRWSPDGQELWFSTRESGGASAIRAVDLRGRQRLLARMPGRIALHDVSLGGRVLVAHEAIQSVTMGSGPGADTERELSWLDGSWLVDLSADGRSALLREEGDGGGPEGALYLRRTDGSPAVRLAEGRGFALSPDGRWVLALRASHPPRIVMLPAGAGESRAVDVGAIGDEVDGRFFLDGRRLLLSGAEPGRPNRLFVLDLEGGGPRAVTPEGTTLVPGCSHPIAPRGERLFAFTAEATVRVYRLDGSGDDQGQPVAGIQGGELPIRWSQDGRELFVGITTRLPARIELLDPTTGRRRPWRTLGPSHLAGGEGGMRVIPTADGRAYVYSYRRRLCDLYLLEGLN